MLSAIKHLRQAIGLDYPSAPPLITLTMLLRIKRKWPDFLAPELKKVLAETEEDGK
jgi:hypothetical protein